MKKRMFVIILFLTFINISAQFIDEFDKDRLQYDPKGLNGWTYFAGDGNVKIDFKQVDDYASLIVDAKHDKRGIWWALIKRAVSKYLDLSLLEKEDYELRVEAKVRVSSAPKRINMHFNTQRTTDFHTHLMEYDISDTSGWHTISMTTKNFDAHPGDTIYVQIAMMDWGFDKYWVDIDYIKVDVVKVSETEKDLGEPIPYHPPIPDTSEFEFHLIVDEDASVDLSYSNYNFNNWGTEDEEGNFVNLLTVSGTQYVILKWNFEEFRSKIAAGPALLELTTYSLQNSPDYKKDFGMVRISEILDGNLEWVDENVTLDLLLEGKSIDRVINTQMIIDYEVKMRKGAKNYFVISRPVMQRLIEGKTKGIIIKPLGAVIASFFASENSKFAPRLHFNIHEKFHHDAKK
ncbi:hypothetical protein ACSSV9_03290 [Melioribacter sp. OK-6-Me]